MSGKHENFWYVFSRLVDIGAEYELIKNDESLRENSTLLGRWAIKYNIIFFILFGGAVAVAIWAASMLETAALFGIILIIAAGVLAVTSLMYAVLAFACSINQLRLNKKPIGVITLLIPIIIIVAGIVAVIISFTMF